MNVFVLNYKRPASLILISPQKFELTTAVSQVVFDLQEVLARAQVGYDIRKGAIGRILKGFCYIIAEMFSLSQHKTLP